MAGGGGVALSSQCWSHHTVSMADVQLSQAQLEIRVQLPCPVYMANALQPLRSAHTECEHLDGSCSRLGVIREKCGSYAMWVLFSPGTRRYLDFLTCFVQDHVPSLQQCGRLCLQEPSSLNQLHPGFACPVYLPKPSFPLFLAGRHEPGSEKHARAGDPPLPGEGHRRDEHKGHGGASPGLLAQLQ